MPNLPMNPRGLLEQLAEQGYLHSLVDDKGHILADKVSDILQKYKASGRTLDEFLIQQRYITEEKFLKAYAEIFDLEYKEKLKKEQVPPEFCRKVNIEFARLNNLVVIGKKEDSYENSYLVATCTPMLMEPINDLASMMDNAVMEICLAPRLEIEGVINQCYQSNSSAEKPEEATATPEGEENDANIKEDQPLIVRMVNSTILEAIRQKASDIHFQPYEDLLQVRYRVDGVLGNHITIHRKYQDAVISRIKVMAKMDIAERRLPQDGRIPFKSGDTEVDIRVSSVPILYGERIVMRLLNKSKKILTLEELGFDGKNLQTMDHYIRCKHGILLVTGPTGSGKSTTLYASLTRLNALKQNIMTIEDPIEYNVAHISQIQVELKKGLTFATGLRTLLRQDPNVIMVGEIRDQETARIAVQASLTGHMVFSTLHTNDAVSAITRLIEIGIEPYLVASSVLCVVAQRLVRKLCPQCKIEYVPEERELRDFGLQPAHLGPKKVLWKANTDGCENCVQGLGYKDRIGLYEVLRIQDRIKQQIMEKRDAKTMKQDAVEHGLKTLRMDGAKKIIDGITTIEEVLSIIQVD